MRARCIRLAALLAAVGLMPFTAACQSGKVGCGSVAQLTESEVSFPGVDDPIQLVRIVPAPGMSIVNVTSPNLDRMYRTFAEPKSTGMTLLLSDGDYAVHGTTQSHELCLTLFTVRPR